jgi:hypothetical protein
MSVKRESKPAPGAEDADGAEQPPATGQVVRSRPAADAAPMRPVDAPRSRDEAEARYVEARDAWIAAMHRANSGRSAHLASLAIAQEAYEAALAEVEMWRSGHRIPIPIEAGRTVGIEVAVGQELRWRRLHRAQEEPRAGFLTRLRRRISGPR